MSFNIKKIRKDFPIFYPEQSRGAIYFDNAATTQKPKVILTKLEKHYKNSHANVHRGAYRLAEEATAAFEEARQKVADFVGAKSPREIVFTRNATEAINLVAYSLGRTFKKGDRILTALSEHHSNFVPWLRLSQKRGLKLDIVGLTAKRDFDFQDFKKKLTKKTRLVAIGHVSNVSGYIYPVAHITREAHRRGALVLIDGAQSAGHILINVQKICCDFFALSGHKMLAPSGIGALYGREEILNQMEPFMTGGEMIREVTTQSVNWNESPWKFEAGTPNIEGAILWGQAIDYLKKMGMRNIWQHEKEMLGYALGQMKKLKFIDLLGFEKIRDRIGIIPFNIKNLHPHDAATLLDQRGIAVRSGHHCAQLFMRYLGVPATLRASFYLYNTKKEIDLFLQALRDISKMLL